MMKIMKQHIVFSDVDGTLLNAEHRISGRTRKAISALEEIGIPFVIISARSPSGIYPILREHGFACPIISYSGALIMDADGTILYDVGMSRDQAGDIIQYIEEQGFDLSWCVYSLDEWIVRDKGDPRILREEEIVKAQAKQGAVGSLGAGARINKILCICNPAQILEIELKIRAAFPACSVVKSSGILLEIMEKSVSKGNAVQTLCSLWNYDLSNAIAFGDNYNDVDMLEAVGHGFLMENAPEPLKGKIAAVTRDNNHDGIYHALVKLGLVAEILD